MERPRRTVRIREFTGLVSNRGALLGQPGDAKEQKNLRSVKPGVLAVRLGMRPVRFN